MTADLSPMPETEPAPVLLYDGECGLCNRVVRMLLRRDRRRRLRFARLQGAGGQAYLRQHGLPVQDFDSLVFIPDWNHRERPEFLLRTSGALAALRECGTGPARLAGLFQIIPERWRDAVYRVIGNWRYRLFGVYRPTPLPRAEWAARFLD
jgi:predicted DCC family thiol-disulfide oxidoreductase YuxK